VFLSVKRDREKRDDDTPDLLGLGGRSAEGHARLDLLQLVLVDETVVAPGGDGVALVEVVTVSACATPTAYLCRF